MSGVGLGQPYGYGLTFQTTYHGLTPAAGASFVFSPERWNRFRLVAVTFTLTTDANAANRYCTVEYSGPTAESIMADGAAKVVVANTTAQRYLGSLNRGSDATATATDIFFPLSGLWQEVGRTVSINVAAIQATDQLSKIYLTFDVWPGNEWIPGEADADNPNAPGEG